MAQKLKQALKAVARSGEYTDKNTGEQKARYTRVGTLFTNERGEVSSLKIDSLPVAFDGWINFYPIDDAPQNGRTNQTPPAPFEGLLNPNF